MIRGRLVGSTHESMSGLQQVRRAIAAACARAGRVPDSVTLVAASKTVAPDALKGVIESGQTVFGENRVQEAKGKWPPLPAFPQVKLGRRPLGTARRTHAEGGIS